MTKWVRRIIVLLEALTVLGLNAAETETPKAVTEFLDKAKALESQYKQARKSEKTELIGKFVDEAHKLNDLPRKTTRHAILSYLRKSKNIEFARALLFNNYLLPFAEHSVYEYVKEVETKGDTDSFVVNLFQRDCLALAPRFQQVHARFRPKTYCETRYVSYSRLLKDVEKLEPTGDIERLICAHVRHFGRDRPNRLYHSLEPVRKESYRLHLLDSLRHVANEPLLKDGKWHVTYRVRRKLRDINKLEIEATVHANEVYHSFNVDLEALKKVLAGKDLKAHGRLVADWNFLTYGRVASLHGYVVSQSVHRAKDVSLTEYNTFQRRRGWVGDARVGDAMYKGIRRSKSFADLAAWRRIMEFMVEDDVEFGLDDLPEDQQTESNINIIGKKTAKRIKFVMREYDALSKDAQPHELHAKLLKKWNAQVKEKTAGEK